MNPRLLVVPLFLACASQRPPPTPPVTSEPLAGTEGSATVATSETSTDEPNPTPTDVATPRLPSKDDFCAQYNRRPRLSDEEHKERYGCPPCPASAEAGRLSAHPARPVFRSRT